MQLYKIMYLMMAAFLFLTYACVSRPDYPQDWNAVTKNSAIPNISGHYENIGEYGEDRKHKPNLYRLLIRGNFNDNNKIQSISISQKESELLIEAYSDGSIVESRIAKIESYNNEKGFIIINDPKPEGGVNRDGVLGYTWDSLAIAKSSDGSLIIRKDGGAVAIMLLIPVAISEQNWYRFLQLVK